MSATARVQKDHAKCPEVIRETCDRLDAEVAVSRIPPVGAERYEPAGYRCPHGVVFWVRPTAAQQARWEAEAAS